MQAAADAKPSGMVSVIGLSSDKVRPTCWCRWEGPSFAGMVINHQGVAKKHTDALHAGG